METNTQNIHIPKEILLQIQERGFYVYNWISANDVKTSIERDFLKILNYVGIPFAIIAISSFIITFSLIIFLGITFVFVIFFMIYLGFLGFFRGIKLSKNGYVVITDTALSINGKIVKFNLIETISPELQKIEQEFEEPLFSTSNLSVSKSNFLKSLKQKISDGYSNIFRFSRKISGKNSGNILFLALAAYTIFIVIMGGVYILGTFIIMIFGICINMISKFILMKSGDEVRHIQDLFEKIHKESEYISQEKNVVLKYLESAMDGNWEKGMIKDMHYSFDKISLKTENILNLSNKLETKLKTSKYASIFNFSIYHSWIKKQIREPLESLLSLLEKNENMILGALKKIESQIEDTPEKKLQAPLLLQKERLNLQQTDIGYYKNIIQGYIEKI